MKKAKEILEMVEGRLSSPLFFSFIISWLLYNWQVVVALLFGMDAVTTHVANDVSLVLFIQYKLSVPSSYLAPILMAIIYTAGNPLMQMCISALYTSINDLSNRWNLKITGKKGLIEAKRFIELQNELDSSYEELKNAVDRNEKTKTELAFSQSELAKLQERVGELNQESRSDRAEIDRLKIRSQPTMIQGIWDVLRKTETIDEKIKLKIEDLKVSFCNEAGRYVSVGQIERYYYDQDQNSIFFLIIFHGDFKGYRGNDKPSFSDSILVYQFHQIMDNKLYGREGGNISVEFQKVT